VSLFLFLLIVAFFAFRGYRKGLLKSIARIASLIAGYAATILYSLPATELIESNFQLQGIVAFITASTVLFLAAASLVGFLFWGLGKLGTTKQEKSSASAIGGAVVGSVVGTLIAIIIVWAFGFASELQPVAPGQVLTQKSSGVIDNLTRNVVSKIADRVLSATATSPEVSGLSRALIESPGEISQQVQRLTKGNELNALFGEPSNQAVLDSGDAKAVQKLPAFQALARNPDMLSLAKSAGMLGEAGDKVELAETALAVQVIDVWGRMQQVKNNQRVQDIMADPEFRASIQSGNPVDLVTNARLLELANIVFSEKAQVAVPVEPGADQSPAAVPKKAAKIYSWIDDKGRIHYSNVEPES
jgi:uncharacterized membrane protein required for colicin V production